MGALSGAGDGALSAYALEEAFKAQFPGKVRKLVVAEAQLCEKGEVLVLLEAMKMEFAIVAPTRGRVVRWRVAVTEQIAAGTLLLDWVSEVEEA
jgi:3-methylcrotonyl-CoA carboxylase alpha subunit